MTFRRYEFNHPSFKERRKFLRLAIELDGGQHTKKEAMTYDQDRSNYLREHNIKVVRFWNNDVLKNMEGVLEDILNHLVKTSPI